MDTGASLWSPSLPLSNSGQEGLHCTAEDIHRRIISGAREQCTFVDLQKCGTIVLRFENLRVKNTYRFGFGHIGIHPF